MILQDVTAAAVDAGERVITAQDAAAIFRTKQLELETAAESMADAGLQLGTRTVARSVGKMRVATLENGDMGAAVDDYLTNLRSLVAYCAE